MIISMSDYLSISNSYKISSRKDGDIVVPNFKTIEESEKWFEQNGVEIQTKDDNVVICVVGGESVNGGILYLCESFFNRKIGVEIIYFLQDPVNLSNYEKTNNKISCNVLQEYARSGLIDSIYLIDISVVHKVYNNIPISKYKQYENMIINDICGFIQWIKTDPSPTYGKIVGSNDLNRIRTISYVYIQNNHVIDFFQLDATDISEKEFYFMFSTSELDSDMGALNMVRTLVDNSGRNSSFAVYDTGSSVKAYHYCINSTNVVKQIN